MKSLLLVALLPLSVSAQYFVGTNEFGHLLCTTARSDFEGRYNFATSAVQVVSEPEQPLPAQFENGIALPDENGHWWKPLIIDGKMKQVQISHSPLEAQQAKAMEDAGKVEIRSARSNRLTRIERIAVDLQQVDAQIEGTNWVDVVLTGISTTAGTWSNANQRATITAIKTALQATKDREQNLKVAVRNLMQATEKVRKEIEP